VQFRIGGMADFWFREVVNARPNYLWLTLEQENAARSAMSIPERKRHEELAIAYEMRCLLDMPSNQSETLNRVQQGLADGPN